MSEIKEKTQTEIEALKAQATSEQDFLARLEQYTDKKSQLAKTTADYYKEAVLARQQAAVNLKEAIRDEAKAETDAEKEIAQANIKKANDALEYTKNREIATRRNAEFSKRDADEAKKSQERIRKELDQTGKGFRIFGKEVAGVGEIMRYVFGGSVILVAMRALRSITRFLKDATEEALNFGKAAFVLELATRNMRRFGTDVNISAVTDQLRDFNDEFQIFSKLEVAQAFAEVTNKMSVFGFTSEQVGEIVRIGMIAYTTDLTGRFNSLAQAINGVTNYLASGYGEALERSGFIAGRAGDKIKAYEEGLKGGLYSLDPLTLAQTRFNLILEQGEAKAADAARYIDTLAGSMQAAKAATTDARTEIGLFFDDLAVGIEEQKADVFGFIADSLSEMTNVQAMKSAAETAIEQIENTVESYKEAQGELEELDELRRAGFERQEEEAERYDELSKSIDGYTVRMQNLGVVLSTIMGEEVNVLDLVVGSLEEQEQALENLRRIERAIAYLGAAGAEQFFNEELLKAKAEMSATDFWQFFAEKVEEEAARQGLDLDVGESIISDESKINQAADQLWQDILDVEEEYASRSEDIHLDHLRRLEDMYG